MFFEKMEFIWVIAGLGNPGVEYGQTRHNMGFQILDFLAGEGNIFTWKTEGPVISCRLQWEGTSVVLIKPQSYMNRSGIAIRSFCDYYRVDLNRLLVVHDDYTLDVGRVKLTQEGGAAGHNGVQNILDHVGPNVARYRIGIGSKPVPEMRLEDYVLGRFTIDEWSILSSLFPKFSNDLCYTVQNGIVRAMNQINKK